MTPATLTFRLRRIDDVTNSPPPASSSRWTCPALSVTAMPDPPNETAEAAHDFGLAERDARHAHRGAAGPGQDDAGVAQHLHALVEPEPLVLARADEDRVARLRGQDRGLDVDEAAAAVAVHDEGLLRGRADRENEACDCGRASQGELGASASGEGEASLWSDVGYRRARPVEILSTRGRLVDAV